MLKKWKRNTNEVNCSGLYYNIMGGSQGGVPNGGASEEKQWSLKDENETQIKQSWVVHEGEQGVRGKMYGLNKIFPTMD